MSYVSEFFDATLISKLEASDVNLPVSETAVADLLSLLSDSESYTYLAIKSDQSYEVVKAKGGNGVIILERGLEGTTPVTHPFGACVAMVSPLTLAVMKDIICNYECCESDCPCEPVELVGVYNVPARIMVGDTFNAFAVFTGKTPISMGASGAPEWMTITQEGSVLHLTGTVPQPARSEAYVNFSIAAANCGGTSVASAPISFEIYWLE